METILGILGGIVFIASYNRFCEWRNERKKENERSQITTERMCNEETTETRKEPDTLGLMFNSLQQFGCQPTVNDDGSLSVQYQGENFHIDFGGMYARVWDPMWAGIKADDPDLPKIREAVNATNFNFGPTIVLTAPDEEGLIGFHSRYDIMLHPACPDNAHYIKAVLDTFFDAKEHVRSNFQQINTQQIEKQKNRRPVGFTTTQKEEEQQQ